MPTALAVVRRKFPEVTEVVDAGRNMLIEVTKADERIANKQDHKTCAMAIACKRMTKADGVLISVQTAYVIKNGVARRYKLPPSVSREVVSFDRNGGFAPGTYQLSKVGDCQKLGTPILPSDGGHSHGPWERSLMGRGSRFTTILTWFREASPDEVRAIMPLVLEACGRRHILISAPAVQRRQRRLNGPDVIPKDNSRAATAAGSNE